MKDKLINKLNSIYESSEYELKTAIDNCGGKNKKSDYKRITDNMTIELVKESINFNLQNDNEIKEHINTLHNKLINDYLVD